MRPASYTLSGWPVEINQLDHRGRWPNDAWNDCLPASLSAVDAYLHGETAEEAFPPDYIRDWGYGDGYRGYTEPGRLLGWLHSRGVPAHVANPDDGEVRLVIEAAIQQGQPILVRTWETTYYHWTPVIGFDQATVTRHQVLGGGVETLDWQAYLDRYAHYVVVVPARRGL